MKALSSAIAIIIAAALVAGCRVGSAETPEQGAKAWFDALAEMDGFKVEDRTCQAQQEKMREAGLFSTMLQLFGQSQLGEQVKIDASSVIVETIRSSGDTAQVRITGKLRAGIGLAVTDQDLAFVWNMVREDGRWKYCGEDVQGTAEMAARATATTVATYFTESEATSIVITPEESNMPGHGWYGGLDDHLPGIAAKKAGANGCAMWGHWDLADGNFSYPAFYSFVAWYPDPETASRSLRIQTEDVWNRRYAVSWTEVEGIGLGDEGTGVEVLVEEPGKTVRSLAYIWRVKNVVLMLEYSDEAERFSAAPARPLAEQMQAKVPTR